MSDLEHEYSARCPTSKRLYEEAVGSIPSGVTHDGRYMLPFPVYIKRARGSHKWDVDGNEYVDYVMGHGALLLGHSHPEVVEAVTQQMARGTHYGACHELELEWARLIKELVPSAERVRFVNSGTEATMMAIRLCRSFTGKNKVVKFEGHFHGWHDYVMVGVIPPYDMPSTSGIPPASRQTVIVIPANDPIKLEETLGRDNDVSCVIIEPSGGAWGTIPIPPSFLKDLREITHRHNVPLIFDEVITGFRYSPGGVQMKCGITPDLTTLAKILGGGLPGGAVVGRADILGLLEFREAEENRHRRVAHPGTYNANPLSAAAGTAALKIVRTGEPHRIADRIAALLRRGLNEELKAQDVEGCVYGEASYLHSFFGPCPKREDCDRELCLNNPLLLKGTPSMVKLTIGRIMLTQGIFLFGMGAFTSMSHTEADVDRTLEAFKNVLPLMKKELMTLRHS